MIFEENNKAIYLQIADLICDEIMAGKYEEESRLPSVRDMATIVEVNSNTVMRSYDRLAQQEMIYNRRGIGFFVAQGAKERIMAERAETLFKIQLPPLFALMKQLCITPDAFKAEYEIFLKNNKS